MKPCLTPIAVALALGLCFAAAGLRAQPAVTLTEDATTYTLANGIVTARIAKDSGDLISLRYHDLEMLATIMGPDGMPDLQADAPGANSRGFGPFTDHQYGFWSHDAMGPRGTTPAVDRVTIDPAASGGERAEVSVLGVSGGRKMGTGPGSDAQGNFVADVEIRYALGRGDSGLYTYSVFTHRPDYPASSLTEARFCAKLNAFFDWMSVAPKINLSFPKDLHEGDKYIYTADQYDNRAFGWSSTTRHVGVWLVNPTVEYLSGGPTKVEFLCHRDTNKVAAPCVLNYWRSSHYGGALVDVAAGESWTKVIGPFLLYVNAGADPQAMYTDAQAQAGKEAAKWPYAWVEGVDYPHRAERATVSGRLVLRDPLMPGATMTHVMVGLTAPDYVSPVPGRGGVKPEIGWQTDAKHYEFWVQGDDDGRFAIPDVRPGTYTLRAFATGVLGEFAQADVPVAAGQTLDLGDLVWTPVRHGRQLWDIGMPNRNATEFFMGEDYADPEISLKYAKLFPDDIRFVIGKSDFRKDWFFQQVPHNEDPNAKAEPFFGVRARGRATPYTVSFDLPSAPHGRATLRLAVCGTGTRELAVAVNGRTLDPVHLRPGDGMITRHGVQGIWYERDAAFDAADLRAGTNTLTLTVPAGPVNDGVVYDYLRLELEDSVALLAPRAAAADAANAPPPEAATEVWSPVPSVVSAPAGGVPSDAIVLFDGRNLDAWEPAAPSGRLWSTADGALVVPAGRPGDLRTKRAFGDVQLHLEWRAPAKVSGTGQARGNSGVFFMGLYELQILDSFDNATYVNGQAAAVYKEHAPLVNAARPPGEWQTYDVIFIAPRFAADGTLAAPARLTAFHNGVLVQQDVALTGPTPNGPTFHQSTLPPYRAHAAHLPLVLQDHLCPVAFRNIWIRELNLTHGE